MNYNEEIIRLETIVNDKIDEIIKNNTKFKIFSEYNINSIILNKNKYFYKISKEIKTDDNIETIKNKLNIMFWDNIALHNNKTNYLNSFKYIKNELSKLSDNFLLSDSIKKIGLDSISIKPIRNKSKIFKTYNNNILSFHQFFDYLNDETNSKYINIKEGFVSCRNKIEKGRIIIDIYIYINIELPKMLHKIIGILMVKELFKDIDSLFNN